MQGDAGRSHLAPGERALLRDHARVEVDLVAEHLRVRVRVRVKGRVDLVAEHLKG